MKNAILLCLLLFPVSVLAQQSIRSGGGEVVVSRTGQVTIKARSDKTIEVKSPVVYQTTEYTGTSSFQPFGIDLNVGAAAGSTDGKFLAPVMGNVIGSNLSKSGNYLAGLIGHYNISGTNATTYPSGAVLGGIGDGTTTAKGAFVAYIDGDSAQTNAGAAFKVMHNNSTAASKFSYGIDLYDAAHDGYNAVSFGTADIRFNSQATLSLLSATASLDFAAWAGDDCQTLTVTVTGAADGNPVTAGIPNALASVADVVWSQWVSAANTVSVRGCKLTAGASADPAAVVVRATVLKP